MGSVAIVMMIGGLLAPYYLPAFLGDEWVETGLYAQILSLPLGAQIVAGNTTNLTTLGLNSWQSAWDFLWVTLIVGSFVLSKHLGFGIGETLMVYAGIRTFVYLVLLVLNIVAIKWKVPRIAAESGESSSNQK